MDYEPTYKQNNDIIDKGSLAVRFPKLQGSGFIGDTGMWGVLCQVMRALWH